MSRTIRTFSGSEFWTNVNSESLLGNLCRDSGAKHFQDTFFKQIKDFEIPPKLAYSMSEEEANDAADKIETLIPKAEELWPQYYHFWEEGATPEDFVNFIKDYAKILRDSKGYECI